MYPQYQEKNSSGKAFLVLVVVGIAVLIGLQFFGQQVSADNESPADSSTFTSDATKLFNKIQSINLDQSIFSDKTFQSLQDYRVDIPAQPTGRSNPFAPQGTDAPYVAPTTPGTLLLQSSN